MMRQSRTVRLIGWWVGVSLVAGAAPAWSAPAPSSKAQEALQMLESDDAYTRKMGFLKLEALRESATLELIRRHLESGDPETRAYSLRAVAAIQGVASVPLAVQTLQSDNHPQVRRAALLALEPFVPHDPAALPACITALRDRHPHVRITAVDIVSRVDDPRAKAAIRVRRKQEKNANVHHALILAMERIGGP